MDETGQSATKFKYPNGYFRDKNCKTCGKAFTPTNPCNLYCTPECRGRNAYYKRVYGLLEYEVEAMKEEQDHKCYLCGGEGFVMNSRTSQEKLVVDHCHKTWTNRKMLCHNCNRALGLLQDDPELMRKAADYIESYR